MSITEYMEYAWHSWISYEYQLYRYGQHVSLKEWTNA